MSTAHAAETEVASVSYVESVATTISEQFISAFDAIATRR